MALLDGNGVSIRRSDQGDFNPNQVPDDVIIALEIENARYMGNGKTARVEFSPFSMRWWVAGVRVNPA
ncbi:MAG: hypothetical protein HC848_09915 [Limnobacter sp.]|nr:hypothetical protein [Limnobacter sp.]